MEVVEDDTFFTRNRRLIAFIVPAIIVHIVWWTYMSVENRFSLFVERSDSDSGVPRW
jgi:hypothetical protein